MKEKGIEEAAGEFDPGASHVTGVFATLLESPASPNLESMILFSCHFYMAEFCKI